MLRRWIKGAWSLIDFFSVVCDWCYLGLCDAACLCAKFWIPTRRPRHTDTNSFVGPGHARGLNETPPHPQPFQKLHKLFRAQIGVTTNRGGAHIKYSPHHNRNSALVGFTGRAGSPKRLAQHALAYNPAAPVWPHTRHARALTSNRITGFCVIRHMGLHWPEFVFSRDIAKAIARRT